MTRSSSGADAKAATTLSFGASLKSRTPPPPAPRYSERADRLMRPCAVTRTRVEGAVTSSGSSSYEGTAIAEIGVSFGSRRASLRSASPREARVPSGKSCTRNPKTRPVSVTTKTLSMVSASKSEAMGYSRAAGRRYVSRGHTFTAPSMPSTTVTGWFSTPGTTSVTSTVGSPATSITVRRASPSVASVSRISARTASICSAGLARSASSSAMRVTNVRCSSANFEASRRVT